MLFPWRMKIVGLSGHECEVNTEEVPTAAGFMVFVMSQLEGGPDIGDGVSLQSQID